jgi:cytidylate kinase
MAVITVSREFGSGGRTLGEILAKELGYTFLDDAVIQALANRVGVTKESVANMERHNGSFFSDMIHGMLHLSYIDRITHKKQDHIDEGIYIDKLREVVEDLAAQDNVVLLGRGSQFILSGHPDAIHFLLVADRAHRIRFMQHKYNLSESDAHHEVLAGEKRRKHVYAVLGCATYNDPVHYDMVLNMDRLSLEEATRLMVALTESRQHEPIIPSSKRAKAV